MQRYVFLSVMFLRAERKYRITYLGMKIFIDVVVHEHMVDAKDVQNAQFSLKRCIFGATFVCLA